MLNITKSIFVLICIIVISFMISCTPGSTSPITIKPSRAYNFGTITFGSSADQDFVFNNKTDASITITSIQITGTNASQFTIIAGGNATTVLSKNTHTISVKFTPIGGTAFAVLRVNYNDAKGTPTTITVDLNGNCNAVPEFAINTTGNPPAHDFGMVSNGSFKDHTFTITNNGITDLTISNVTLSLNNFTIQSGFTIGTPEVIPDSTAHQLTIRFTPTIAGVANATLAITHNASNEVSPFNINLSGEGRDRGFNTNVTGNPLTVDFGNAFSGVGKAKST
ncbi:MAG: choice-of-anchor D domain-containing protein, partial [Desulfobacula sp.]|nr:choice-of-anchor D domain-containing protein [Desulfobacula sp.]